MYVFLNRGPLLTASPPSNQGKGISYKHGIAVYGARFLKKSRCKIQKVHHVITHMLKPMLYRSSSTSLPYLIITVSKLVVEQFTGRAYSSNSLKYQTSRSSFLNTFFDHSRPSVAIPFACNWPASSW